MNGLRKKITCFLGNHVWGGYDNNTCVNCNKRAVGLPKYKCDIPPPPSNRQGKSVSYCVVQGNNLLKLVDEINNAIQDGWEPKGNPFNLNGSYSVYQAMTKETKLTSTANTEIKSPTKN